jgi:hypothetical protein
LEPSEEIAKGFKELRFLGHEVIVFQILDRDELEFPFEDSAIFEDPEGGDRRRVSSSQVARAVYLERFGEFMARHKQAFQSLEIPHCVVRTDENPASALAMFLAQRRKLL